jgi:hypothetical protein
MAASIPPPAVASLPCAASADTVNRVDIADRQIN